MKNKPGHFGQKILASMGHKHATHIGSVSALFTNILDGLHDRPLQKQHPLHAIAGQHVSAWSMSQPIGFGHVNELQSRVTTVRLVDICVLSVNAGPVVLVLGRRLAVAAVIGEFSAPKIDWRRSSTRREGSGSHRSFADAIAQAVHVAIAISP